MKTAKYNINVAKGISVFLLIALAVRQIISVCSLASLWFVVEISRGKSFNNLSVQVRLSRQSSKLYFEKAIKDNDPEIRIYAPLNHKAGVKCSYVYIL